MAKFVVNFFDRVVAAFLKEPVGGVFSSGIAWSVNGDAYDWTGEGSGFQDLGDEDLGNPITGMVAFEELAIVLRKKSIHHITRQPFSIAPFRFQEVIRGIGSDIPFTTVAVPGGVIFADSRTQDVYLYEPGSLPKSLGAGLNRQLFLDLKRASRCEATYDPYEAEYHLGIVETSTSHSFTRVWVYNLRSGAWSYDDGPPACTLGVTLRSQLGLTIDDAPGTINSNSSPINEASGLTHTFPTLHKGTLDGNVVEYNNVVTGDYEGTQYELTFSSPNIGDLVRDRTLQEVHLNVETNLGGTATLELSVDETTWREQKSVSMTISTRTVKNARSISGHDLFWRLKTTARGFKLYYWWARVLEGPLKT